MFLELSEDNLAQYVSDKPTVFVQFSAGWCGNCRLMKPKFKKLSDENQAALFVLADAEKYPESRKLAQVNNLPTFAAFRDGQLVNQLQTNKFDLLKEFIDEAARN